MTRNEEIALNIRTLREKLGNVELCAVTKTMPVEDINAAIDAGITEIGENRVQELMGKIESIRPGARISLIGRLQTNKVKYLIGKVGLIQSLDRDELAREISKRSVNAGVVTDTLIEVSIAGEEQKGGVPVNELIDFAGRVNDMPGIHVKGLMTVMPIAEDPETLRPYFRQMRMFFEELRRAGMDMEVLSMGMSNDWRIAADEGSTMVRVGRGIFGSRNY
ncbi:MAG: YggS family pyridoxal phosphate-dependent enzyme [Clostridia bacterium]|nr:YggS family pyridoxal phosphate-dependent enzyme [Clostridia bacterium]